MREQTWRGSECKGEGTREQTWRGSEGEGMRECEDGREQHREGL